MDVPAALWNAGTRDGSKQERVSPRRATNPKTGGRRPKERSSSQVSPQLFFNMAGAFKPVSLELYTVSEHVVHQLGLTSIARCPRSWLRSPYLVLTPSPFFFISRRTSLRLPCPWNSAFVGSNESVGPLDMDDLYSILSSQRGKRSDSSAPMQSGSLSAFPSLWSFVRRSSHSLWLRMLRYVSVFAPS